jgi:hypothetical protein
MTGGRAAYQIIREDNSDIVYMNFAGILNDVNREDLQELYQLVNIKYGDHPPEDEFERVFWGNLKVMFEPPTESDIVWKLPEEQNIVSWRYFHTCKVHCVSLKNVDIYMLAEVEYPLSSSVCKEMMSKKLYASKKDEGYEMLLDLIKKQSLKDVA